MARNVEIKARVEDIGAMQRRVAELADSGPVEIRQDDTFFPCANGRLKLRTFSEDEGELIYYRRENELGPTESFYVRSSTPEPAALRECLRLAYGEAGRVIKLRKLFAIGRTRVHLDRVEGLGDYLELEVVLEEEESLQAGIEEANRILVQLGIARSQLVEGAYVDLMCTDDFR